jgi:isopenicillin-N N-acyltransferase-like protein
MSGLRCLVLAGDAKRRGELHGKTFRDEIRHYTEERVLLASNGSWAGRSATRTEILQLAEETLPAHRAYDAELYEEMDALARASGLSPAEMVIVGGFTDFVDLVRAQVGDAPEEDDCTAVIVPDALADGAGFLAQTWDMHDTATEHVAMLEVRPDEGPAAHVFSTVGCLGQIGMNDAGIAVGINNLTAEKGQVGVTWPFVVRKILQQTDLEKALSCVLSANLAGAHNYLLFDRNGRGYNVEAMPERACVTELDVEPLVHTNHCLDREARAHEAEKAPALLSSSERRLLRGTLLLAERPVTLAGLTALTRDPDVCQRARPPFNIESSGAVIMRPATGDFWAVSGIPADHEYEHLRLSAP